MTTPNSTRMYWPTLPEEKEAAAFDSVSREPILGRAFTFDYGGGRVCQSVAEALQVHVRREGYARPDTLTLSEAEQIIAAQGHFQSAVFQQAIAALAWLSDLRLWAAASPQRWVRVGVGLDKKAFGRMQATLFAELADSPASDSEVRTFVLARIDSPHWVDFEHALLGKERESERYGRNGNYLETRLCAQSHALLDAVEMCNAVLPVEMLCWPGLEDGVVTHMRFWDRARLLVARRLKRSAALCDQAQESYVERLSRHLPGVCAEEWQRLAIAHGDSVSALRQALPLKAKPGSIQSALKALEKYRECKADLTGLQARSQRLADHALQYQEAPC